MTNNHHPSITLVAIGAAIGTVLTYAILHKQQQRQRRRRRRAGRRQYHASLEQAEDRRQLLPKTIIILRHGESEANLDKNMWRTIPDNLLGLTPTGEDQARIAGERVEAILRDDDDYDDDDCCHHQRLHLVVSPFERTLQTATAMRPAFEHRIVRTDVESRIREQEVGNLQGDDFKEFRKQQKRVGRFWYRFPTGESGADVLDRVKSWWFETVLTVNMRIGFEPIDAMVVVTHGLTLRFILMQLFGWSPTTFHSVWNAPNCGMYVLRKDLEKPGPSPYVLDKERGDMPRSSIDILVEQKDETVHTLRLENYLSIPPPRTTRLRLIKRMLAEQHPETIRDMDDIRSIVFMPFVEGRVIKGRSTSGVQSRSSSTHGSDSDSIFCNGGNEPVYSQQETSGRFPCIDIPLFDSDDSD